MEPILLDGRKTAAEINEKLKVRAQRIIERTGYVPELATIIVGDDHASKVYVRMKANACKMAGISSRIIELSAEASTGEVIREIELLNGDDRVSGILLQHPVPAQIDEAGCFNAISPAKDVDGVNHLSFARFSMGVKAFKCATPYGIIRLLKSYAVSLAGKNVVILGRSPIFGKPLSMLMLNEDATVTVCHSRTKNIKEITKRADILCIGIGRPRFVDSTWIREGAVVVDAGYNPGNVGDADLADLMHKTSAYTPVPGGVGPMTIITLVEQTVESAEKTASLTSGR